MPRCGMTPFGPAAVAFSLALVACGAVDAGEWTTSIAVAAALPPEIVEASVGRQLAWLIHLLNTRDGVLETREVEAHYHPSFLAWKPTASVIEASAYLAQKYAPLAIRGVQRAEGEYLDVLGDSAVGSVRVRLWVDGPTRLIRGVLVEPYADLTMEQIAREIPTLAPRSQLLVAEIEGGQCVPRVSVDSDAVFSIASTSKLYVLLALIDAVIARERFWDELLTIREPWKSTPESALSSEPGGAVLTLRAFAEALISESDNTANDHLIRALGREAVEDAMQASGHHDPGRNVPYMTSKEFFRLRMLPDEEIERYFALGDDARRSYLERVLESRWGAEGTSARNLERVGIFASSEDLCRLLAVITDRAERHAEAAPALEILGKSGMRRVGAFGQGDWTYVGGKGGSLRAASFHDVASDARLLRRADGRWFVIITGFNSDGRFFSFDTERLAGMKTRLLDLLASPSPQTPAH